jgi:uncharacterized membrane protein
MEISKSLKLIFILLAIIFFLSIIPYLLAGNKSSEVETNAEIENNQSATTEVSNSSFDIWNQLNKPFAEKNCLRLAKEYAVNNNIPAIFITSCKCSANESADVKSYSCTIKSIDSSYPVEISCFQSKEMCTFESSFETNSLTFDQAKEYLE